MLAEWQKGAAAFHQEGGRRCSYSNAWGSRKCTTHLKSIHDLELGVLVQLLYSVTVHWPEGRSLR